MPFEQPREGQDAWLERTTEIVIDVPRAAAVLGVSRSTAYEAVRRGEIPSLRLGRRVVVPVHKLRLMLGVQYVEDAARPPKFEPQQ